MTHKTSILSAVALLGLALIFCGSKKQDSKAAKVWAGVSVNHALYTSGWTNELVMEFAVFNDGGTPAAVNPCIDRSTLIINGANLTGKDHEWFAFNLGNGPRAIDPLPVGRGTSVTKSGMGRFFEKPGLYHVVWKSECFESQPLVFRVMPPDDK